MSQLGVLSAHGLLNFWDDRQIGVGEDWYQKIENAMNAASVAILLVSADSLPSEFILREEVRRLLERRDQEGLLRTPFLMALAARAKVG
jgi:TIR domain